MMNITERAMLVNLSIKQWTTAKHDAKASAEVAAHHNSDVNMGRYNKQLVNKHATKELTRIKGAARTEHYKRTLPWSEDGSRILSAVGYFDYCQVMRDLSDQWDIAVYEFIREYPSYVIDARNRLNGLFRDSDYPSVNRIQDKFSFGFNVFPLPSSEDFRIDLGSAETARIKSEIQSSLNSTLETAMSDVWERMKTAVSHMAERLRSYKVDSDGVSNPFRDSLVENLRDLLGLLPSLNLTGNRDIDAFAARIESELLNHNAETLRSSDWAREETACNAEDILRQMGDFI